MEDSEQKDSGVQDLALVEGGEVSASLGEEPKVSKRELKRRRKEQEWQEKKLKIKEAKVKDKEKINKSKQKRARNAFAAAGDATKEVVDEETGETVTRKVNRKERKEVSKGWFSKIVVEEDDQGLHESDNRYGVELKFRL